MPDSRDAALWNEYRRQGLPVRDIGAEAFAILRRYADRQEADGTVDDAFTLLCPAVLATDPATARRIAGTVAGRDLPAAPPAALPPTREALDACPRDDVLTVLLAGFAHWAEGLRREWGCRAFGIMRDGGVLADAVAMLAPDVGKLWLLRRLCLVAALASAEDREGLANLLQRARGRPATAGEAVQELGVAEEPLPAGLASADLLDHERLAMLCDWLATGRPRLAVNAHVQALRRRIVAHLRAAGALDGPAVALLDVGYAATVQRTLQRILALEGWQVRLHGAYLVTTPGALWALRQGGSAHGFLADLGAPGWFAAPFLRSREVIEAHCTSGDGPLLGYDDDGRPVLGQSLLPAAQRAAVARAQSHACGMVGQLAAVPDQAAVRLRCLRLLTAPTADEAARLGAWLYDDPLSIGHPRRLAEAPPNLSPEAVLTAPRSVVLWPAALAPK